MYFCSSRSAQSLVCLLIFIMSWTIKQREWSEMLHLRIKWGKKKKEQVWVDVWDRLSSRGAGFSRCFTCWVRDHSMKSDKPFGSELVNDAFPATKREKALSSHSIYVGFLGCTSPRCDCCLHMWPEQGGGRFRSAGAWRRRSKVALASVVSDLVSVTFHLTNRRIWEH